MLLETRATQYVYHASNDTLEVRVDGEAKKTSHANEKVTLLLDAKKKLVGVDLRGTPAGCVLMLGQHEDVVSQVEAKARLDLDASGGVAAVEIEKASGAMDAPAKNPYL